MESKADASMRFMFVVFILLASELFVPSLARELCKVQSKLWHGILCLWDYKCSKICIGEGYTGGHCSGDRIKCICFYPC
uniref:Defensin-like protein 1 n=1 Tax=Lilium longiflorum TaxID=4690 RepID=A0A2K9YNF8_LILLO|nr:defensin-like protein 1 [Lilium longiflorum]